MKQKLLEMVEVTVMFHTDAFIFVCLSKTVTDAKTASEVPNLDYFAPEVPTLDYFRRAAGAKT